MMDNCNVYFFIEPYVYISNNKNGTIFYNSLNGLMIYYKNNPVISLIAERLLSDKNLYVLNMSPLRKVISPHK